MQYSPKLKNAIAEIKAILDRNDIAGLVVLHTPGYGEYIMKIDTSYSCASFNGDELRVKAKLADFNGDKKAWKQKVTDTSNMLNGLAECMGPLVLGVMDIETRLRKETDAEHTGPGHTSNTQQNN